MTLRSLLQATAPSLDAIASYLDGLPHDARLAECMDLGRSEQRILFGLASTEIDASHFVPPSVPDRTEVIHHGRNTLPVFTRFQKRFCRPEGGPAGSLCGYNEGSTRALIGPGYFVAEPTAGTPEWEPRGAFVVNYFKVPDGPVVDGWPTVVPNSSGLQMFVYKGTRDFMRRVSQHVSIGEAYKGEKSINSWFILVREDRA
jgi:hypothetical protein